MGRHRLSPIPGEQKQRRRKLRRKLKAAVARGDREETDRLIEILKDIERSRARVSFGIQHEPGAGDRDIPAHAYYGRRRTKK